VCPATLDSGLILEIIPIGGQAAICKHNSRLLFFALAQSARNLGVKRNRTGATLVEFPQILSSAVTT
jgi:hypothetical protein